MVQLNLSRTLRVMEDDRPGSLVSLNRSTYSSGRIKENIDTVGYSKSTAGFQEDGIGPVTNRVPGTPTSHTIEIESRLLHEAKKTKMQELVKIGKLRVGDVWCYNRRVDDNTVDKEDIKVWISY
jgi:hypothetical protein